MMYTVGMMCFVLAVAVGNLMLGYATAVYLGRGPRRGEEIAAGMTALGVRHSELAAPREGTEVAAPGAAAAAEAVEPPLSPSSPAAELPQEPCSVGTTGDASQAPPTKAAADPPQDEAAPRDELVPRADGAAEDRIVEHNAPAGSEQAAGGNAGVQAAAKDEAVADKPEEPPALRAWEVAAAAETDSRGVDETPLQASDSSNAALPEPISPAVEFQQHLAGLRDRAGEHQQEIESLDRRVRKSGASPPLDEVRRCADDFRTASRRYCEQQLNALSQVERLLTAGDEFAAAGLPVVEWARREADAAQSSAAAIEGWELNDDNLHDYCKQLLEQTSLRVQQSGAFESSLSGSLAEFRVAFDVEEDCGSGAAVANDAAARSEEQARLRHALRAALRAWREADPQQRTPFSAMLVDVDRFGQLKADAGEAAAQRVLGTVAAALRQAAAPQGALGETAEQRFLVTLPGADAQEAALRIEQARQQVERTRFQRTGGGLRVTVSCAVAEGRAGDSSDELLQRLEATLQEAKRYGRNRTFVFFEGKYPTPIAPPKLSLPPSVVMI